MPWQAIVPNFIQVSIFILQNKHGQILLSLRDSQKELPNQWEFPGGKVERHEGPYQALLREAREELSIKIKSSEFLMQYFFSYKDLFVHLYVWLVKEFEGNVYANEGQELRWVDVKEIYDIPYLEGDKKILDKLSNHAN
ncbi:MAG: (deoxy)nucleoside triphosphate pyrophosphohydrolase [Proteobacteria bacterium]|nr:(deoxy)nucleoside triphosphate pyrophosphohydrolase [Pseudomonadota bacterium]